MSMYVKTTSGVASINDKSGRWELVWSGEAQAVQFQFEEDFICKDTKTINMIIVGYSKYDFFLDNTGRFSRSMMLSAYVDINRLYSGAWFYSYASADQYIFKNTSNATHLNSEIYAWYYKNSSKYTMNINASNSKIDVTNDLFHITGVYMLHS